MRRWNGWGDEAKSMYLPENAQTYLLQKLKQAKPLEDATLKQTCSRVPVTRIPEHHLIDTSEENRVRHAFGQSLPDWLTMRSGQIEVFPDGVAFPENQQQIRELLNFAQQQDIELIPYGGGTSVVGHITPRASKRAILTVDLSKINQLEHLNESSQVATIGAGASGPQVESQLRDKGYTLGHFPQSFELSTIGGWVASRSSGQQSLRYGRIEQLFAGGSMETFEGTLEIPTFPASSAGPDLREMVLGSEGRFGIISQVKVRVSRLPEKEDFYVCFFPNWNNATAFCREIAQQNVRLSMLRVSNALETETQLKIAGKEQLIKKLETYLKIRGCHQGKCMLTYGITGTVAQCKAIKRQCKKLQKKFKGIGTGASLGKKWAENRFKLPYLREALWLKGYAVDTLETAIDWQHVDQMMSQVESALTHALDSEGESIHVFTHLSHVYGQGCSLYTSYLFRCADTYEKTYKRWQMLKKAACDAIVANHGTISHQHGVGKDHAPFLKIEKGTIGMSVIKHLCQKFDPDGRLNPGTLIDDSNTQS